MMEFVLLLIGAFILGSIPFGVLVARARGVDITKIGSGNIGATNVHRALGWKAGVPVMILDIAKGLIPALVGKALKIDVPHLSATDIALLSGFAAVLGHCFSPFLKFKGGKGVATILGATIGAVPIVAAIGVTVFALIFVTTRYVSLASICAVLVAVMATAILRYDPLVIGAFVAIAFFIIYKHRANIGRLMKGEEPKTSFKGGDKRD